MDWRVASLIAGMDAAGIDGVLLDEFVGYDGQRPLPSRTLPGGCWRAEEPFAEAAVAVSPDRFAYVTRVDPRDPEIESVVARVAEKPGRLALRPLVGPRGPLWSDPMFLEGGYGRMFRAAERCRLPVFAYVTGRLETLRGYVQQFPDLPFVIDHTGVELRLTSPPAERWSQLDRVVGFSSYPNVYLKWCHVEWISAGGAPFTDAAAHLRRLVDAFGQERIMWASDYTLARRADLCQHRPPSWADLVRVVAEAEALRGTEKDWLLGLTVQSLLGWTPGKRTQPIGQPHAGGDGAGGDGPSAPPSAAQGS